MRVAHVFKDSYPPVVAGITRYVADLAAASAKRGVEVEVRVAGVRRSRSEQRPDGVTIHRFRESGRALSMPLSAALVRAASKVDADVVHVHLPNPVGEFGALANRGSHGLVVSFHAQLGRQRFLAPVYGPLQSALVRKADRVLAASPAMMKAPELALGADRLRLVPMGVSPRMLAPDPAMEISLNGPLRVLFVGRLVYYKGLDVLLDAIAPMSFVELAIIGDGEMRNALSVRIAADQRLSTKVVVHHDIDDDALVAAHLSHDVFVLPSISRAESFGLSMAEAMANGLPAISTSLGTGTDWVNLHDKTGLVVAPGDVVGLRGAIESMRDDKLRNRLAAGSIERARGVFSFDRHLDLVHRCYEAAIAS